MENEYCLAKVTVAEVPMKAFMASEMQRYGEIRDMIAFSVLLSAENDALMKLPCHPKGASSGSGYSGPRTPTGYVTYQAPRVTLQSEKPNRMINAGPPVYITRPIYH